ncbi:MAG: T9SS type A sorting domain-containing protein [Flammeovirgaceae bacterium]
MKQCVAILIIGCLIIGISPTVVAQKQKLEPPSGVVVQGNSSPIFYVDGKRVKKISSELKPDQIKEIHVFKGAKAIELYGKSAKNGVVVVTTKSMILKPLYVVDGTISTKKKVNDLRNQIESITVTKDPALLRKYKQKNINAAILVTTKSSPKIDDKKTEEPTQVVIGKEKQDLPNPTSDFKVIAYPNPSNGKEVGLQFFTANQDEQIHVEVMTLAGKIIHAERIDPQTALQNFKGKLHFKENLSSGLYLIMVQQGKHSEQLKLVIE